MNVLFLTLARISNISERGIYTDLMRKFCNEGHNVYIVTPIERRLNLRTNLSVQGNAHILSVKILNVQKTNIIEKGIGTLTIENFFYRAIRKYLEGIKFKLILYSTPPITFSSLVSKLKNKYRCKSYLLLKDIFPQNAVDLRMFSKKSLLYKYFRKKERQLYSVSDYIGCMSPANVRYLMRHNNYIPSESIEVAPNSLELSNLDSNIDVAKIRQKYGLPSDKVIFIYGGNLGKPQGLSFLLKAINSNKDIEDAFFLIVGSGTEYEKICSWFNSIKPRNAMLLKCLPKLEYDNLVGACDVGLILLDNRFTIPNYPSRLLSYMEHKMPIIAATDLNTDIGSIAENNGYGLCCENGDLELFNSLIVKLLNKARRVAMGKTAYEFLCSHYLVENTYNPIISHFIE
jgi:hypothetical protein